MPNESEQTSSAEPHKAVCDLYLKQHAACGEVVERSLSGGNVILHARSHEFAVELDTWVNVLSNNREVYLYKVATREYQYALLALVQGQYCDAFKDLRLVLELVLQGIYLSANRLELEEWLSRRKDTVWNDLVDKEKGVLSQRFCNAFSPDLGEHVLHYQAIAAQVYRECSEYVHGNVCKHIALPNEIGYHKDAFLIWHKKADHVALILSFALALRYLGELDDEQTNKLEQQLDYRLGHIRKIRLHYGGEGGE